MRVLVRRLWAEGEGQGVVEYALAIAFIAVAIVGAAVFLSGRIQTQFSTVGNSISGGG